MNLTSTLVPDISTILPCSIRRWLLGAGLPPLYKGSIGNRARYLALYISYIIFHLVLIVISLIMQWVRHLGSSASVQRFDWS